MGTGWRDESGRVERGIIDVVYGTCFIGYFELGNGAMGRSIPKDEVAGCVPFFAYVFVYFVVYNLRVSV